ncbi:acetaldehyde dehydrogenase [Proteiniborus ethanoligenes]|uniref:Acetaldehyde dehydrogenase n=1 Tax=Proteiniborus ethanoligenes TaxID=415015 RepID=A0A1H3PV10_9FIRM|nr:acetaldehyde dehydrogenase (acetylating) [Proteiniborus ethanoligenes]SDZ04781.1 acetaldehyde dehydrogenase [Proteiniborus ethanoligenes]
MSQKVKVAIIGPGNIGTDLMYKVQRSSVLEMSAMIGIMESEGINRARNLGIPTSIEGIKFIEDNPDIADIVIDATTAKAHSEIHGPILEKLGKIAIDLTPAAIGKIVSPMVNMEDALKVKNVNLITCGGQATTPIIYTIGKHVGIEYAEVVTAVASKSAGPGTRNNIDEYTRTTARAIELLTNSDRAKVLTIFNPAIPEVPMRNTIFCIPKEEYDIEEIAKAVEEMVKSIQEYVPGYTLTLRPTVDKGIITTIVTIEGQGDFLPPYAGNLDIETASAVKIAELYAKNILKNN